MEGRRLLVVPSWDRLTMAAQRGGVSCKMPRPECEYSEPASGDARIPAAMRSAALMANEFNTAPAGHMPARAKTARRVG
eukprot:11082563-Lingulodinium_polyedra.AAC.1